MAFRRAYQALRAAQTSPADLSRGGDSVRGRAQRPRPRAELDRMRALNAGCGPVRQADAIGLDRDTASAADLIHDLDNVPWPFANDRFEEVRLSHVLEHVNDPDRTLREAHRICRSGGKVFIATPHYSSHESYNDLTHRYHFGLAVLKPYYAGPRAMFLLSERRLLFGSSPLSWPGRAAAALSFDFYERYICWLCPGRNMEFVLEVRK